MGCGIGVGGVGGAPPAPTYKRTFVSPAFKSLIVFHAPLSIKSDKTFSGDLLLSAPKINAAAPLTCGHAMDVPENVAVPESLVWEADRTLDPGAHISVHVP